jgi:hypothetical protein
MRKGILKSFRLIGLAILLTIGGLAAWPYILQSSDNDRATVQADVPRIENSKNTEFIYEYEAATFNVLIGDDTEKPRLKLKQGLRTLDITVIPSLEDEITELKEQPINETIETEGEEIDKSETTEDVKTINPPDSEDEDVEEAEEVVEVDNEEIIEEPLDENPSPTPEDESLTEELFSWRWNVINKVYAQQKLGVINAETEPAVEFADEGVVVTPDLDKVTLDFEVSSALDFPAFYINSENLTAYDSEGDVIFKTRTNRDAFTFTNAIITGVDGSSNIAIISAQDQIEYDPDGSAKHSYAVTIKPDEKWKDNTNLYPALLEVDIVSLFHDRMLPIRPVKKDFKATEDLIFNIDVASVKEEDIKEALADDTLPGIRFGLIDSVGRTKQLFAEIIERQENEELRLSLSTESPIGEPGLFDLLIQYEDDQAYISEEDFSWGVLAINPDQAVYQPGSEARIDMAVLDSRGHMVCNADVVLSITSPTGEKTILSMEEGTLQVTEDCTKRITDLPDYTTSYQTGPVGEYALELTATTRDGSFTVTDSFAVSSDVPVYIKRLGPTRIYPVAEYTMTFEIAAQQDVTQIEELVPSDFIITDTGGAEIADASGVNGTQRIVWEQTITAGETSTVQYTFDAPNISPALFLLGPATVIGPEFSTEYIEPRQWQVASDNTDFIVDTGQTSYTTPPTWNNSNNYIEVIGGGAGGLTGDAGTSADGGHGNGAGGGGAYSKITDLTLSGDITIQVGDGGGMGAGGEDTFFNRTAGAAGTCADTVSVCAKGGGAPSGQTGGSGGSSGSGVGETLVSGGNGGNGGNGLVHNTGGGGGGGGGAGGCGASACVKASVGGTGNNGDPGTNSVGNGEGGTGGIGGQGDSTYGGTAGTAGVPNGGAGGNGGNGDEWDATPYGSGGGGGGGAGAAKLLIGGAGGTAGTYGGGGGGGGGSGEDLLTPGGVGGAAANGIIVVSWTPVGPSNSDLMRHGNYFESEAEQSFYWAQ